MNDELAQPPIPEDDEASTRPSSRSDDEAPTLPAPGQDEASNKQKRRRKPPERKPTRAPISAHEAKQQAAYCVKNTYPSIYAHQVIDYLARGGVLTDSQLTQLNGLDERTLRNYFKQHLLDLLPWEVLDLARLGIPHTKHVYTLGSVGLEIGTYCHGLVPTGYYGLGVHRITHDLLANQVVIHLIQAAAAHGYEYEWHGKYQATVHDTEGRPVLEPDAMLICKQGSQQRRLLLEYHHEDSGRRAIDKVERYEELWRNGHWRRAWQADELPLVLICWTHRAVGSGYRQAIELVSRRGLLGRYLGKPWDAFQTGHAPTIWQDFKSREMVDILA